MIDHTHANTIPSPDHKHTYLKKTLGNGKNDIYILGSFILTKTTDLECRD